MASCDLTHHPRACVIVQKKYRRPECDGCKSGEKNAEMEAAKAQSAVPRETNVNEPERKETEMDIETAKTGILRVLARKGAMSASNLKLFAARRMPKEEFMAAIQNLAQGGKIITTEGARPGSLSVRLPGTSSPSSREPVMTESQPNVKQRQIDSSWGHVASRRNSPPPKNGGGRTGPSSTDLRYVGMLQERTGILLKAISDEAPIDGELLDLFCLTTDWLRERRASA